jgi:hypothetical protein
MRCPVRSAPPAVPACDVRLFRALHPYDRDTPIRIFLQKGWSLRLRCFDCGRIVEWIPPQLLERFAGRFDATRANLAQRAVCGSRHAVRAALACTP